jgi:hypothetical protein
LTGCDLNELGRVLNENGHVGSGVSGQCNSIPGNGLDSSDRSGAGCSLSRGQGAALSLSDLSSGSDPSP